MTINELTIILVSGAFLKCFSIYKTYVKMMKNDTGVILSSFLLQIHANKEEQFFDAIISNVTVF